MDNKKEKAPMTHKRIYGVMLGFTLAVGFGFFLINVMKKNYQAVTVIGACMTIFVIVLLGMKIRNVKEKNKEFVLAMSLLLLDFVISLYSGESYSDDFPLFLAIIGMTGLYLEPKYTRAQVAVADILLVVMYIIHPEKAGDLSQFILCEVVFTLAGILFCMTIKRGRAFIQMSDERAREAELLLQSIRTMGDALQRDFDTSSSSIESSTNELQQGSVSITQGTIEVSDSCGEVHDKIQKTERQISALNTEVKKVEQVLMENQRNIKAMNSQLRSVGDIVNGADVIFRELEEKMREVSDIAGQLNFIAFNTTILSLNATIEAARAGQSGSGFEVVAGRMRELSESSNVLSDKVAELAKELAVEVEKTSQQFTDSTTALQQSDGVMIELQESFGRLTEQFTSLYDNIEEQNRNVQRVDEIFDTLNSRVHDMQGFSVENQSAVEAIVRAMDIYKSNISEVIKQTQNV